MDFKFVAERHRFSDPQMMTVVRAGRVADEHGTPVNAAAASTTKHLRHPELVEGSARSEAVYWYHGVEGAATALSFLRTAPAHDVWSFLQTLQIRPLRFATLRMTGIGGGRGVLR